MKDIFLVQKENFSLRIYHKNHSSRVTWVFKKFYIFALIINIYHIIKYKICFVNIYNCIKI